MLTADNITDEQIRELLDACDATADSEQQTIVDDCYMALAPHSRRPEAQRAARARCAEILEARNQETTDAAR